MKFQDSITIDGYTDLQKNELRNARIQNLSSNPSSPVEGQIYWNSSSHKYFIYDGTGWVDFYPSTTTLDAITAPAASLSLNSQKITNLATPTGTTDAATKGYVDGVAAGLSWKASVRAATTANGSLTSAFENGDTIDGVTLVTGDRILLKNQSTAADNGIYVVNASGSPTRATDADSGAELLNAAVFVQEGTTNADTAWVCTTNAAITVGSTALAFAQFSATGYTFTSGVQASGNTVSANVDSTTISVNGSNQLQVTSGYFGRKVTATITGNSSTTTFTLTHSLGTKDIVVSVRGTSSPNTDEVVYCTVKPNNTNTVDVTFATAPATGVNYTATIIG